MSTKIGVLFKHEMEEIRNLFIFFLIYFIFLPRRRIAPAMQKAFSRFQEKIAAAFLLLLFLFSAGIQIICKYYLKE